MNDTETGFSMGSYEACSYDGRDLLDCSHFPGLEDNSCAIGNNDGERQKFHEPLNDENGNKVNTPERKSYQNAVSELKAYSSSVPFAFHSLDEENKRANLPDDDTVSSSNQGELLLWVNDYKCSLCGIELPRCFVEERQEHFDIHRAERLQKEESRCDIRMLRHRIAFFTFSLHITNI
nr:DNA polymerase kappa-like [Quercus suber]